MGRRHAEARRSNQWFAGLDSSPRDSVHSPRVPTPGDPPQGAENPRCRDLTTRARSDLNHLPKGCRHSATRRRRANVMPPLLTPDAISRIMRGAQPDELRPLVQVFDLRPFKQKEEEVGQSPRFRMLASDARARGPRTVRGGSEREVRARRDQTIFHPSFGELSDHASGR